MSKKNRYLRSLISLACAIGILGFSLGGCSIMARKGVKNVDRTTPNHAAVWADNCGRCHNLRSPDEFRPDQWEMIVRHMRVRASLTADESKEILDFLKASK
jgi:hypothetical protein